MKRDMDLIRDILFWMEEHDADSPRIPEKSEREIGYHCHLLADAGLIVAANSSSYGDTVPQAIPISLTSRGHDFIDSARNKTVWSTVKNKVATTTGGASIAIMTELLKEEVKRRLGLSGA
ncbi:DUF2513 domain-containing protein [Delftia acidovorans]